MVQSEPERGSVYLRLNVSERFAGDGIRPAGSKTGGAARQNLRSWFSVHVFGRLQGTSYAAGYMYATEKITPRFVPLQVILSRYELNLALVTRKRSR